MMRHFVERQQPERGLQLLPLLRGTDQIEETARLFELEAEARFHVGHRFARQLDKRTQQPVLATELVRLLQFGQLLHELARRPIEAGLADHTVFRILAARHESRAEPDVERRRQDRAAVSIGRALRDGGVALDDAYPMAGGA